MVQFKKLFSTSSSKLALIVVIALIITAGFAVFVLKYNRIENFVGETPIVLPIMYTQKFKNPSETCPGTACISPVSIWKSSFEKANDKTTGPISQDNVLIPYELTCVGKDGNRTACGNLPVSKWNVHGDFNVDTNVL
jgi:hypothetical protein